MAQNMSVAIIASSPPSGGTVTHHGTPSTLPTMMSPEGGNGCARPGSPRARLLFATPGFQMPANLNIAARRAHHVPKINTTVDMIPCGVVQSSSRSSRPEIGIFTIEDTTTRGFSVVGINIATPNLHDIVANLYGKFESLIRIDTRPLRFAGAFSVEFSDFRDALQALLMTKNTIFFGQRIECLKMFPKDTAHKNRTNPDTVSNHVAEYLINVIDIGQQTVPVTAQSIFDACQNLVGPAFRDVKAVQAVQPMPAATSTWRVEWFDSRVNAMSLSGVSFQGYCLTVMPFTPDVENRAVVAAFQDPEQDRMRYNRGLEALMTPSYPRSPAASPHNVVDLNKIRSGQDVRTTLMLRNIPNRVDQAGLEEYLNESSRGQYDFMYLRIDFANNCNVGYAFINFTDPMAIVAFAQMRAGRKWNVFQSEKVAEISYATIQGRDCLIQKFRNSSVMLEQPAFRPKLYLTYGPRAGEEEPFPEADNHAKLRRSCDNAEHVGLYHPITSSALTPERGALVHVAPPPNQAVGGVYTIPARNREASRFASPDRLFAPREGSAYRNQQRREFSQYDRGTPSAEQEQGYRIKRERSESTQPSLRRYPTYPRGGMEYYEYLRQGA